MNRWGWGVTIDHTWIYLRFASRVQAAEVTARDHSAGL